MKLDPRIVVQFVVIAEEASFTRAARRLHVAQPWLSGRIKRFEEQLGFSLFVRNAHGIELTSKGAALLEVAHSVELSMTATESVAASCDAQIKSVLVLACLHTVTRLPLGMKL